MNISEIGAATAASGNPRSAQARLREATGRMIGSMFFGTMLKAMRESSLKTKYGHGGRGEEIFGAQLHGVLAEQLGVRMRHGVGDALFKRLDRQQQMIDRAREAAAGQTVSETKR